MTEIAEAPKEGSPKYQEWLDRLPQYARRTPKGTVVSFKINVNRFGHGYLHHMTDKGAVDPVNQPVTGVEQAVSALREVWARAEAMANAPQENGEQSE